MRTLIPRRSILLPAAFVSTKLFLYKFIHKMSIRGLPYTPIISRSFTAIPFEGAK